MKQLLAIAVLAFSLTSCSEKHCWNCRIDYKNSMMFPTTNGQPGTGTKSQGVCDKTSKEIKQYETENTLNDEATKSSVTYDCVRDYYK